MQSACLRKPRILVQDEQVYKLASIAEPFPSHRAEHWLVEVQAGGYFGEDDIVRLDDRYGRDGKPAPR